MVQCCSIVRLKQQLFQQLDTTVQQALDVLRLPGQVEQEGDVLGDRQIGRGAGVKDHLDHGLSALSGHAVLVKVGHVLELPVPAFRLGDLLGNGARLVVIRGVHCVVLLLLAHNQQISRNRILPLGS